MVPHDSQGDLPLVRYFTIRYCSIDSFGFWQLQHMVSQNPYILRHKKDAKCITTDNRVGVLMENEMLRSYLLPQGVSNATE